MALTMVREAWTDERLDDLNAKVDRLDQRIENGFVETREEIRGAGAETHQELKDWRAVMREELEIASAKWSEELKLARTESSERFEHLHRDMREVRTELGSLNRTIHQFMFAIVGTIFLGFMGTISALATLT